MNIFFIDKINIFIESCLLEWNSNYSKNISNKLFLNNATHFLLNCLDKSINLVEDIFLEGKDKKSAVLLIMAYLYENIIYKNLPIYLKPFATVIRMFFVQVLSSILIDFIVNKYNEGSWNKRKEFKNEK